MQRFNRSLWRLSVAVFFGFIGLVATPGAAQICTGDCNSDHRVVVSELVTGVNIALTSTPVTPCLAMDVDSNGRVAVNELVAAVTSLLRGCPATFTPSPTATSTRSATPTITLTPTITSTQTPTGPPVPTPTPSITRTPSGTFTPTSSTPSATPTPTIEPLTLTVQVNPDPVAPGETMLAAITVTNRRSTALANLVVQGFPPLNGVANFGAGFTSSGGICAGGTCRPGQPITWNLGALPAGSARTVTAPITVLSGGTAPADGTTLIVHATATADNAGSLAADGITTVESAKILALSLDADVDAVPPGEMLRYTLSFGNRSAQLQMDGTLTMPVPAGATFESASGGGIETSGSVVWALGNLAPGDSGLRDLVVRINDTVRQGQTVTAEATLTAGSSMAEAQAITHVQTAAALTARIDVGPDPVVPGETLLVSLTVTNRGPVDLFTVMAAVRMPAEIAGFGVGFASDGPACSGAFCDFPERVIWTLGTLAAGQGITVTMPATVNSGASAPANGALITFDGDAIANDGSETRARRSVRVRASRALELEMDVDPQPVLAGEDLHYRLTFGNRGTGLLQGTLLEMAVPAGTTFQSATDDGVETSGRVRWTLGALAPGASGVRELVAAVDAGAEAGEPITAEGTVTSGAVSARAQAITLIEGDAPLQIVVAAGPNPVEPSEALLVSATVTNRGLVELTGVVAALRLPAELAGFGAGFASDAATCSGAFCDFPERVVWNLGTLPAGQGITVTMPGFVNAVATTPGGTVIALDADASDSTGRRARARHSVAVRPARALELELEAGPQPVSTGGELRYRLTFGNRGIGLLQATSLTMPVPEGTTFQSASEGGLEVDGTVHWALGDLAPGLSGVREMVVQVNAGVGEPIAVEAAATSGIISARAQAVTQVEADLPLTLELSAGPDPIAPGESLLVSLTATNRGLVDLPNVVAAVRVPAELAGFGAGFTSDAAACSGGFCDFPERVVWDLGTVPAGQGVTVTMPGTVNAVATTPGGTVIVLDADASADGDKRVRARHNIAVRQTRAMELEIEARPQPVSASEDLHYTLTFGNRGIGLLQNALLEIPVPAGTTFQSASDAGTEIGGTVQWSLGDLAPGASGVRELVVQVDANADAGEPIAANARVTSSTVTAHAQTVTQVEVDAPLTVSLTTAPDPVAPSEALLVSLTIANRGLVDLFAVTAAVRMPAELAGFGAGFTSDGAVCSGGFCDFPERVIWNLGTLATGRGITVTMPGLVNAVATTPSGTVIVFDADASANDGSKARARHNLVVQASRPLELELATSPAPAGAGEQIDYTLTFGNRSAAVADDAVIEMPVPVGTTFQGASDGGVETDGVVEWSLGDLAPGASGVRELMVQVDPTARAGEPIFATGRLTAGARAARAHAVTQVQENVPLSVSLTASPDPAMPGMAVLMSLMVTNTGPVDLFGVTAGIRVPQEVSAFGQGLTIGGGACFGGICDTPERVVWTLGTAGTLGVGQSVTVTMPPPIPGGGSAPVDGTVILFDADVSANDGTQVRARRSVRVQ